MRVREALQIVYSSLITWVSQYTIWCCMLVLLCVCLCLVSNLFSDLWIPWLILPNFKWQMEFFKWALAPFLQSLLSAPETAPYSPEPRKPRETSYGRFYRRDRNHHDHFVHFARFQKYSFCSTKGTSSAWTNIHNSIIFKKAFYSTNLAIHKLSHNLSGGKTCNQ